ncbi:hypothetical protein [Methanorbis furvi]|uniref:Uncharacterized protein n=1 Tax=Methanorbis furvi TaxID=3028299 RepID=A0AAE4S9A7_9EURY|nr:hypothetical protein [Methanocorpusculaceae archaeon Ag1]
MSIMQEATVEEPPVKLNRKDITGDLIGAAPDFNFDEEIPLLPKGEEQEQPEELNAVVGILDMLIGSSGDLLKEYDLPAPNLTIWEKWGKENLSKALNHYMPAGMGEGISSPAMAGLIGVGAILICFLPVIMVFVKRKQEPQPEQIPQQPEPEEEKTEFVNTYETPEPVHSTAPISDKMLSAWERIQRVDNGY